MCAASAAGEAGALAGGAGGREAQLVRDILLLELLLLATQRIVLLLLERAGQRVLSATTAGRSVV